jgi:hypothetical protein
MVLGKIYLRDPTEKVYIQSMTEINQLLALMNNSDKEYKPKEYS